MEKTYTETIAEPCSAMDAILVPGRRLYGALIFYLSSLSHPEEELPKFLFEQLGDKLLHVIEYAVLALLCYRAFRWAAGPQAGEYAVVLAIVATSLYGLTDELHQAFVPLCASPVWLDWIADTAGAMIGAVGGRRRFMERGSKQTASRDKFFPQQYNAALMATIDPVTTKTASGSSGSSAHRRNDTDPVAFSRDVQETVSRSPAMPPIGAIFGLNSAMPLIRRSS